MVKIRHKHKWHLKQSDLWAASGYECFSCRCKAKIYSNGLQGSYFRKDGTQSNRIVKMPAQVFAEGIAAIFSEHTTSPYAGAFGKLVAGFVLTSVRAADLAAFHLIASGFMDVVKEGIAAEEFAAMVEKIK